MENVKLLQTQSLITRLITQITHAGIYLTGEIHTNKNRVAWVKGSGSIMF